MRWVPAAVVFAVASAAACSLIDPLDDIIVGGPRPPAGVDAAPDPVANEAGPETGNQDRTVAPPPCDLTREFGTPSVVASLSTPEDEGAARFSDDELTVWFDGTRGADASFDLYTAKRDAIDAAFADASALAVVNAESSHEYSPAVSSDGQFLFFERAARATPTNSDLFVARLDAGEPDAPAPIVELTTSGYEANPYVRGTGDEIWYAAVGPDNSIDVFVAERTTTGVYGKARVAALSATPPANDDSPVVSSDGLVVFFASTRALPGLAGANIWMASRSSPGVTFDAPVPVANVNSSFDDRPTWISADGCRLYLSSNRPGGPGRQDILVATRPR